eukprot:14400700-Ditylum_brightwellii.AAC.2
MIELNDYLVNFPLIEGVTPTKISCKDFTDILEDGILFQRKLEFEKEGFNSSSDMLKDILDMCMQLEEAKMHKPLVKKIAHAKKENDEAGKEKCHGKLESHHKRHHSLPPWHEGVQLLSSLQESCSAYSQYHGIGEALAGLDKIDEAIKEHNCNMH